MKAISIREEDRRVLEHWVRSPTTPQRLVQRSRMVLLAADGVSILEIGVRCDVSPATVRLWLTRYQRDGLPTLEHDAPGRGRPRSVDVSTFRDRLRDAELLDAEGQPVSLRRAGTYLGVSASAVWRAVKRASQLMW